MAFLYLSLQFRSFVVCRNSTTALPNLLPESIAMTDSTTMAAIVNLAINTLRLVASACVFTP